MLLSSHCSTGFASHFNYSPRSCRSIQPSPIEHLRGGSMLLGLLNRRWRSIHANSLDELLRWCTSPRLLSRQEGGSLSRGLNRPTTPLLCSRQLLLLLLLLMDISSAVLGNSGGSGCVGEGRREGITFGSPLWWGRRGWATRFLVFGVRTLVLVNFVFLIRSYRQKSSVRYYHVIKEQSFLHE
uniref:Transmembrane protein n=1 Tax=Rodentolepis nana TaxID=102285 RepID=A0A0R3TL34_RODNA